MSDPKQLKFQFVVDEASLQKTRQLIRELTADLAKLNAEANKAGNIGGGGVSVSAGAKQSPEQQKIISKTPVMARPIVQGFMDGRQIFKQLTEGSKDSLRAMDQTVKSSVSKQKQELDALNVTVKNLRKSYQELSDIRSKAEPGSYSEQRAHKAWGDAKDELGEQRRQQGNAKWNYDVQDPKRAAELRQIYGETGQHYNIKDMEREIREEKAAAGGGGPGLTGARSLSPKMMQALKIGGMVLAGATMIQGESMAGITGQAGMEARRADIVSGQMQRLMGGDVKLSYAMKTMDGDMRRDLRDVNESRTGKIDTTVEMMKNAARGVPIVGGLFGSGKGGAGGIGGAFTDAEKGSYQAEKAMALAEAHSKSLIMENFAMDRFSGNLGARMSAGRQLGLGLNPAKKGAGWDDTYGRLEDKLSAGGYSVQEYQGAKMGLQAAGGERFGFQYAGEAMRANAQGLGGYSGLLAAGQRAGIGGDFARGAIGGGIDANAGVALGTSIIGSGFDPRGTTTGMGALMAVQGGFGFTGEASDFNTAQRAALGLQGGDALTTGGLDPYQKGRNLVSAVRANPGMNIYGQDYLANGMSMKQMIDMGTGNSPLTATAEALGLNSGQIKKQLGSSVSSVVDRYRDTGANDPMSKSIRGFRAFQKGGGGGISEYFDSLKGGDKTEAVRNMGAFYGIQTGQGEEAGLGLMGLEAGMSNAEVGKLKKGSVGRGIGKGEKAAAEGMADAQKQVTTTLENIADTFTKTLKDIPNDFSKMKTFNERLDKSATEFITSLGQLTTAIKTATGNLGGGFKTGAKH